jgi:hypothetical protein
MSSAEDRLKILKQLEEGKISAAEGLKILDSMGNNPEKKEQSEPNPPVNEAKEARWFRVMVTNTITGKVQVNVRLPLSVVAAGIKMGARFAPEVEGLNMDLLMDYIRSGETGKITDMTDEIDHERVEVFIEC